MIAQRKVGEGANSTHPFEGNRDLLDRFRRGDRTALEQVYWCYVDRVERLVRGCLAAIGANASDAPPNVEDLVQDVFARAFGRGARQSYDGLRDYGPYLFTVARNAVADAVRLSRREVLADFDSFPDAAAIRDGSTEGENEQWADPSVVAVVRSYVAALPAGLRDVHHQRYVLGLSQDGAAAALGISRQQLRTLEKKLRRGLARELSGGPSKKRSTDLASLPVLRRG